MIPISPQNKLTKVLTFMFGFADWEPRQPISAAMDVSTQKLNRNVAQVGRRPHCDPVRACVCVCFHHLIILTFFTTIPAV